MSPIYVFKCHPCDYVTEELRKVSDYTTPDCGKCGEETEYTISVPQMQVWDQCRSFPNVTQHGDGSLTFKSKDQYYKHLSDNNSSECSTDAPVKTAHGTEVTVYPNGTPDKSFGETPMVSEKELKAMGTSEFLGYLTGKGWTLNISLGPAGGYGEDDIKGHIGRDNCCDWDNTHRHCEFRTEWDPATGHGYSSFQCEVSSYTEFSVLIRDAAEAVSFIIPGAPKVN